MRDQRSTQLLFELSRPGRRAAMLPDCDVPRRDARTTLGAAAVARAPAALPELSELDVVRHFVNLSGRNMSVDSNFYPLGSCTMKYNPKRQERLAALPGIAAVHPLQPDATIQGYLELLWGLQAMLGEIAGLPAVSLQPAAGAHGELTALLVAAAYFRDRAERRTKVLIPDTAHGTNPASAAIAGFDCVTIASDRRGYVDLDSLRRQLSSDVAVFMITNPNTLGLFDPQIGQIAELLHAAGALLYLDGANMNAILGQTRPGDFGVDMMHYNVHKTFTGPHGAGGPGAGPIAVRDTLAAYLPVPMVGRRPAGTTGDVGQPAGGDGRGQAEHDGTFEYYLDHARPKSIGRVRGFFGNVGILFRGYCYLRTLGPVGLRRVAEHAVLNANYLRARVSELFPVPYGERCMHEFIATAVPREGLSEAMELWQKRHMLPRRVQPTAMDIAKRLLDFGFHAPTVYFPLVVPEAMMIEPTETESKETLDAFVQALQQISREDTEHLRLAPHTTHVSRADEVAAARQPVLRWRPS
jgi:glycine dehydrogenase subunit 2